jgi:hypothetical protein
VLTVTIPKAVATSVHKVEVKRSESLVDKAKKLFTKSSENSTPNPQA